MHAVVETSVFSRRADALLSLEQRVALINLLAETPMAGLVIPGTGGVRKLRFGGDGRGKRGGFRVVYYVLTDDLPVVAITIYGKNEKADLTAAEKKGAWLIVERMKASLAAMEERGDGRRRFGE